MPDPTPEQLAAIDQNMALARHYLRSQTTTYASLLELAGSEVDAQQQLLETLGLEEPDTLAKLLAMAIADRHAQGKRWAEVAELAAAWESRAELAGRRADQDGDLTGPNAIRSATYLVCIAGLRQLLDAE